MEQSRRLQDAIPSLLTVASATLALGAVAAVGIGWFWVGSRGDWQAVALWTYWLGEPVLSGLSLVFARGHKGLRRINVSLLGIWATVSLLVLILPFLSSTAGLR